MSRSFLHGGQRFLWTLMLGSSASWAVGAPLPHVQIDVSSSVECRDVTALIPAATSPDEKVVEARFRVSILLDEGRQEDIEYLLIVIESPERRLRVVDFQPKTELMSDVAGEILTQQTTESFNTCEGKLSTGPMALYGVADLGFSATGKEVIHRVYRQLPAKCMTLASGTIHGAHGVFFKIKGSAQTSLEGEKEFVCWFLVPRNWRGDWCTILCEARAVDRRFLSIKQETCGEAKVLVGLYLAGDDRAKELARQLEFIGGELASRLGLSRHSGDESANFRKPFDLGVMFSASAEDSQARNSRSNLPDTRLRVTLDALSRMAGGWKIGFEGPTLDGNTESYFASDVPITNYPLIFERK